MSKIDTTKMTPRTGSAYPGKLSAEMAGRSIYGLGNEGRLTQFGVNLVMLEPGAKSSLRHWHMHEDEFVLVTEGELVLVMDEGETSMSAGECAAFKAGVQNGHHLINKSDKVGKFLVVGTRAANEVAYYSDIDMKVKVGPEGFDFTKKDGSPLDPEMGENS